MRTRWIVLAFAAVFFGALVGVSLAPAPAGAASREIIQLQQQVAQLLQNQQDMRSAMDANNASLKTLLQQAVDNFSSLNSTMGGLQKTVQDSSAANGSRLDTLTTQTQALSDNLQDLQARVGKVTQQLTDLQSQLQSIDAKVSATPGPLGANAPNPTAPPISADTLYQNGLRDFTSGKYDLARQEFSDYLKNFPSNELASNCQFYLGEIAYAQGRYQEAISTYDKVLVNYPNSYKLASALYKKAMGELQLGQKSAATRDLREVVRRFPGTDEAHRSQAKLHELTTSKSPAN